MSFTFADFQARFPELASVNEDFYNTAKVSAALSVNPNRWAEKTDEGIKLMTAHIIALSKRGGVAGQIKRTKVGDLEREYGVTTDANGPSTSYLAEFNRVMKSIFVSPFFIC